jgi:membrane-bound lytic murein transglycosylase B
VLLALVAACSSGSPDRSASSATPASGATPTTTTTTAPASTTTAPATRPPPSIPTGSADVAVQLVADERAVRDPASSAGVRTDAARRIQVAYRAIGRNPDWDAGVLSVTPAALRTAVERNIDARRHLVALVADTPIRDTLPAWRIQEPAPAAELRSYYDEGAAQFGVGWSYLAAINLIETGFGRINGLSTAGAQGPMQFLPSTWEAYGAGGDIESPHDSIVGAARYLAANGFADGNVDGALRRYNQSDDYVAAVKDYAAILADEPDLLAVYHAWDVYYFTVAGDIYLPVGYEEHDRVPVDDYLAAHPR